MIIDLKAGCFLAFVKLLPKLSQSWSIGLHPFLSEWHVLLDYFLILEGRKCLKHTTVDLVTLKQSLLSPLLLSCTSLLFQIFLQKSYSQWVSFRYFEYNSSYMNSYQLHILSLKTKTSQPWKRQPCFVLISSNRSLVFSF